MIYKSLADNPLKSHEDLSCAFKDAVRPYVRFLSEGCAGIETESTGASFGERAVHLEGFARILWGLVPYLAQNEYSELYERILLGLSNGVNPDHEEFWGRPGDYDQRLVEMAVFGYALCFLPKMFWEPLDKKAKRNLARWLSTINTRKIPDCNWIFFRILVNCGLKKVGSDEYREDILRESLSTIAKFYLKDGWYNDGYPEERRARDYYVPWALHYYGLIFARCCSGINPTMAGRFREHAALFAKDFLYWFDEDGAALPYGRSLTYRFAQGAFWGALAFADVEALPWGQVKGLHLRNLRWWFKQPFFSETGLQSIGYTYPNLHMAERYNSPNSPLWSFKAFIPLSLPESHPFWQAEEKAVDKEMDVRLQEQAGFIVCDSVASGHLHVLSSGQWTPGESNEHNHMAEKYSKFAYSAYFGFNVATDTYGLDKLAPDNMLLLDHGDRWYRYRTSTKNHTATKDYLYSEWIPFSGTEVGTYLIAHGAWSVRIHRVRSDTILSSAEGGFALPFTERFSTVPEELDASVADQSYGKTELGFSGIRNLFADRRGKCIVANSNANIIHPRTIIPTLLGELPPGVNWLGCAVTAHPGPERGERLWRKGLRMEIILRKLPESVQREIERYLPTGACS